MKALSHLKKNTFKNIEYLDAKNGLENTINLDIKDVLKLSNTDEIFIEADAYDILNIQNLDKSQYMENHIEGNTTFAHYNYNRSDIYIDLTLLINEI